MAMEPQKSFGQSFDDLRNDLKGFIETRYEILRAELSDNLKQAKGAAMLLAAASVFALVGLVLLGMCVSLFIALAFGAFTNQVGLLWGFLITSAGNLLLAGLLGAAGRARLRATELVPERTLRVLKRDEEALQMQQGGQHVEPERRRA